MNNNYYQEVKDHLQKIFDIEASIALLNWDQETYMPKGGAAQRSRQISTLSTLAHELTTDKAFIDKVTHLYNELDKLNPEEATNIRETYRQINRASKLDSDFVKKRSECISKTYQIWIASRESKDTAPYIEQLKELVSIKQEEAERIGYEGHIYNALLEEFEPGMRCEELDTIFEGVKSHLKPLLQNIKAKSAPKDDFMYAFYDKDKQWDYGIELLKNMGYDFNRGRQDLSVHPFSTGFGSDDIRVTTRVNEHNFASMIWSCIHEGGHALYEQGMLSENYGLPMGRYISLGIHESQSRLWENHVARSKSYWTYHYPETQKLFEENLSGVSMDDFYAAANKISATPIRTEADELHYHFHVLIRYEIEKDLMDGSLPVDQAEERWNALYKEYLGLDITDPNEGILQDIHWSLGSIGYFPTYSIGSFYAAQFYQKAKEEIPGMEAQIEQGDSSALLSWLNKNIHEKGMLHGAKQLCEKLTGETLSYDYFKDYVEEKYGALYQL